MCKKFIDNINPLIGVWGIITGVKVCKKYIDNISPLIGVWGIITGVKVCKKYIDNISRRGMGYNYKCKKVKKIY